MKKHLKTASLLLCIFIFLSMLIIISDKGYAEQDIKDYLYTDILPGQTLKDARKLFEENKEYTTEDNEISGQYIYTVTAIENVEKNGFAYFGHVSDKLGISYDKTKGKIIYTNVNIWLDDVYGSDVTEIQEDTLEILEKFGTLIDKDIKDSDETYRYQITIKDSSYILKFYTRWGDEESTDAIMRSFIAFNLTLDNGTNSKAATSTTETNTAPATLGQQNALRSAKNYLSFMGFSRTGLIRQLMVGDGYSEEEATYAADNCGADWNEQAVKSAQNYLSIMGFSRSGLIQQLMLGDGYTEEEANYAADQLGL